MSKAQNVGHGFVRSLHKVIGGEDALAPSRLSTFNLDDPVLRFSPSIDVVSSGEDQGGML